MTIKKKHKIPQFKTEDEEREFWARADLTNYFDPDDFVRVSFPNLKPSSRAISLRVPEYLIERIKEQANELDIPYQSLMKQYLARGAYPDGTRNGAHKRRRIASVKS